MIFNMGARARVEEGFAEREKELFAKYYGLVTEVNKVMNLTSITEENDFYVKHIEDSLSALCFIDENGRLFDIGSGAGMPAIPIKIARPGLYVCMAESVSKKAAFLERAARELGLQNTEVKNERAEILGRSNLRGSFDFVTARAVAPLVELIELAFPLLKVNGKLIAYKGKEDETADAAVLLRKLNGKIIEIKKFALGGNMERSLVVIEKLIETPEIYPRDYKKIKKKLINKAGGEKCLEE